MKNSKPKINLNHNSYTIQRPYFETSHAKGQQDTAGSHIKQKVSPAVIRRTATITDAKSMYTYLLENFTQLSASSYASITQSVQLSRPICFFVPSSGENAIERNCPGRQFKSVKGICKWHSVRSLPQQEKLLARFRSCYCMNCILNDEKNCLSKEWLDEWKEIAVPREAHTVAHTVAHIVDLAAKEVAWSSG